MSETPSVKEPPSCRDSDLRQPLHQCWRAPRDPRSPHPGSSVTSSLGHGQKDSSSLASVLYHRRPHAWSIARPHVRRSGLKKVGSWSPRFPRQLSPSLLRKTSASRTFVSYIFAGKIHCECSQPRVTGTEILICTKTWARSAASGGRTSRLSPPHSLSPCLYLPGKRK